MPKLKKVVVISIQNTNEPLKFVNIYTEFNKINSSNKINKIIEIVFLIIKNIIKNNYSSTHYVFIGNSICRIAFIFYFFFKKKNFVYLEIPNNLFYFYDFIILRAVTNIFFTSRLRVNYIKQKYKLKKKIFIYPLIRSIHVINKKAKVQKKHIVFIGTFHVNNLEEISNFLKKHSIKLSILTNNYLKMKNNFSEKYISFKKPINNPSRLIPFLQKYKFGLLFYPITSVNNNLCTPLKIFDYISSDLVIISFYKNKGLKLFKKNYPNLIYFYENNLNFNEIKKNKKYIIQKKKYFDQINQKTKLFENFISKT